MNASLGGETEQKSLVKEGERVVQISGGGVCVAGSAEVRVCLLC